MKNKPSLKKESVSSILSSSLKSLKTQKVVK